MKNFNNIKFNGTFRDYQSIILKNANEYLKDGRVNIVAAPGSGKTILGLELIRGMSAPALVLSPSVTIRQQWGQRFESNFIPQGENPQSYVSYDLKEPSLITSVTYQALHAAYSKTALKSEADEEETEREKEEDFSGFDLISTIKSNGIRTICLDEAHHLRSEWQKALEGFLNQLGSSVVIISLTATPPYDSTPNEWKRYSDLCGEIDEEIFVPQLVAQKTLCPHQDYIYFSYPTDKESEAIVNYNKKSVECTNSIITSGLLYKALEASKLISSYNLAEELLCDNFEEFSSLIKIVSNSGVRLPQNLTKLVEKNGRISNYTLCDAEKAFQFVIDRSDIFTEEISENLRSTLSQNALIDKRKVCLNSNDKLNKILMSSMGKLSSINQIVNAEYSQLRNSLRMLILTDFIKKDMLGIVGTNDEITSMGTVPIFESIRRNCDKTANLAVLSGTLVILPNAVLNDVVAIADSQNVTYTVHPIDNTIYSKVNFSGSNKNKVSIITEAFQKGFINILIGTKSLLGEGWDSPCINSLILASFVGSFMLSNQMRGRAIRIDKTNLQKASNIWHLVTVEPQELSKLSSDNEITGGDYDTVKQRFECFLAPAYHSNVIESGIERIDILKPPYNKTGFDNINRQMLSIASDRETMKERWNASVNNSSHPQVLEVAEIPKTAQPKGFVFKNKLALVLLIVLFLISVVIGIFILASDIYVIVKILMLVAILLLFGVNIVKNINKIKSFVSPENTVKTLSECVFATLKSTDDIKSSNAIVKVTANQASAYVSCMLANATAHENKIFSTAVSELFSPIDNPRYILIKDGDYTNSFACPSIIGNKKENAETLASYISKKAKGFSVIYTRSENGRRELLKCKKYSYINLNSKIVKNKKAAISR